MYQQVIICLCVFAGAIGFEEKYPYAELYRRKIKPNIYDGFGHGVASPQVTGFPVLPPPITTVPTGTITGSFICVAPGTCITAGGTSPGIDIRIVTANQTVPPVIPGVCPAGTVACFPIAGGAQCGARYATGISTADGPSTYGAFPWQAYILNQTQYTGSGVLLDQWHVLTAAHKVDQNVNTPGNIRVYMGVWNTSATDITTRAQFRVAATIRLHPNYNSSLFNPTLFNDIAIIRLNSPISLGYQTNINTACQPVQGQSFVNSQNCIVSGWGQTGFGLNDAPVNPQKQVTVPIVSYETCRVSMSDPSVLGSNVNVYLDPTGELCAGGVASRDACTQDGGSPLVCPDATGRYTVAGLVIWGKGCGRQGVYGVYVNVAQYRTWIDQTVAALNAG